MGRVAPGRGVQGSSAPGNNEQGRGSAPCKGAAGNNGRGNNGRGREVRQAKAASRQRGRPEAAAEHGSRRRFVDQLTDDRRVTPSAFEQRRFVVDLPRRIFTGRFQPTGR